MAKKQKERRGGWQEAGTVDSDDEKAMEEVKQEVGVSVNNPCSLPLV